MPSTPPCPPSGALPAGSLTQRPTIGLTCCLDPGLRFRAGTDYLYLSRSYSRALAHAGAAPVLLTPDTPIEVCLAHCEGVVLTGGGDLPERFDDGASGPPRWAERVPGEAEALERIEWERALLNAFAENHRPVLGVCFGMQLMNLHFGGSLHVDLKQRPGARGPEPVDHGSPAQPSRHALTVSAESSFLAEWHLSEPVSSSHQQAVASLAPGFMASAWASDGVIEAIERGPLVGVEWHPESDASAELVYGRWVADVLRRR